MSEQKEVACLLCQTGKLEEIIEIHYEGDIKKFGADLIRSEIPSGHYVCSVCHVYYHRLPEPEAKPRVGV